MDTLTRRNRSPELMDDPAADRSELERSLAFIRKINFRLGGVSAALRHLQRWSTSWSGDETIRLIDIGTGSGDIPAAIADWATGAGFKVHITAVDLHETTLAIARDYIGNRPEIEFLHADALKLMDHFEAGSFHYAHTGMFLHHLSDIEVMTVLRIMDRLTTRALIWNDLVRGWLEKLTVRMLTLGATAMVKHDAAVSVDAGFKRSEVRELARRVGLEDVQYYRHLFGRFTLVSRKIGR